MAEDVANQYWYNMKTGEVEHGFQSPSVDRVGPFSTAAEASNALEVLRANSAKWAEDDDADNH